MAQVAPTSADIEPLLQQARQSAYAMAVLTTQQKNEALGVFADLIADHQAELLSANQQDLDEQAGQVAPSLYQRLALSPSKLTLLVQGIRDVIGLPDPVGTRLSATLLDNGLILEKISVPLGVIGIIFESRPDVIPQILSLILKSGNAVILKGGREATHSNRAFMDLVKRLNARCGFLPATWAQLVEGREAVQAMLHYPQYIDLIIPRGSNELVQSIMAATKIPVLGHADGICHLFVDAQANQTQAIPLVVDAKAQYPVACNTLETLLVHATIAAAFLPRLAEACAKAGIALKGCDATRAILPHIEAATETDWRTEYGEPILAIRIVPDIEAAITHINHYGSHHTDAILSEDPAAQATFVSRIDSANVFVNASTRFADGFRYGLGAEVGISTAKTHARGPVGLEGLAIYKYVLRGNGHVVKDYVGDQAKAFLHQAL